MSKREFNSLIGVELGINARPRSHAGRAFVFLALSTLSLLLPLLSSTSANAQWKLLGHKADYYENFMYYIDFLDLPGPPRAVRRPRRPAPPGGPGSPPADPGGHARHSGAESGQQRLAGGHLFRAQRTGLTFPGRHPP